MTTSKLYGVTLSTFLQGLQSKLDNAKTTKEVLFAVLVHEIEILEGHYHYLRDRYKKIEVDDDEFALLLKVQDKLGNKREKLKRYEREM